MAGSISVTEGAGAAFGSLGRAWLRCAGALGLVGLLSAAMALALRDRDFARAGLVFFAYLAAGAMARGALLRLAFATQRSNEPTFAPGFGGFQWGAVEWRILAVTVLRGLLFGLLGALFLTVLFAVYVGMAAAESGAGFAAAARPGWRPSLDATGWVVVSAVGLLGTAGLCWVGLRLYLAFAATVAVARVRLLSTWALTRGRTWRILGAVILILLPSVGLALVARVLRVVLTSGGVGAPVVRLVASLLMGLGDAFLVLPLSVGLMIYLYDRLGPENAGVS